MTLSQLVNRAVIHERMPAPFDPRLRMGAWGGTAGVILYVVGALATRLSVHHPSRTPGFFVFGWRLLLDVTIGNLASVIVPLAVTIIALALELALLTRGFKAGPLWTHLAAVTTSAVGVVALVPVLVVLVIVVLNLALWALLVALVVLFTIALMSGLVNALFDA